MPALLDDRSLAQRILDHIEHGTTDLAPGVWSEPVENYRSQARLADELGVLRRTPTPFCPSAALAEPGAFVAREAAGTPLVAVRGADGGVRAFRNACRHRGMQVATGSGCAKAFVCRYHGWSYDLEGRLFSVPHAHGFPDLDRSLHGLVPVAVQEAHGLVFISQDEPACDLGSLEGVPPLLGPELRLFAAQEARVPANWKLFLEGLLEGYHIRTTHPESFFPYGFDNLNVIEHFGPNSRVTFPFRRIGKLAQVPPEERRIEGKLTFVYHLFPNAVVTVFSRHTRLVVLEPCGVGETRFLTYALSSRRDGEDADPAAAERDASFVNDTGGAEDMAVICAIQRGLASGANQAFTYGRFEGAISHFHRALEAALARGSC